MIRTILEEKPTQEIPNRILNEISKVIIDKQEIQEMLLITLLSEGHLLIEGLPGTAKTLLAKTFAQVIGGDFKRIQFTPDMLPADITGFYLYTPDGKSRLIEGPIAANVVLADELNRTTPRTQAALIEAMQEKQVTIEGKTRMLPKPFMVIASQLPYGSEGTYPLTEVQADRFMYRVWSDYLDRDFEEQVLSRIDYIEQPDIKPAAGLKDVIDLQQSVKRVHVSDKIKQYIISLIIQTRKDPDVISGPSTRASIAFFKGARTLAYLQGRDYVLPDDVKKLISPVLTHRIHVKSEAEMEDITPDTIIERVTRETPVPKID